METIEFFAFSGLATNTYGMQYVINKLINDGYNVVPYEPTSKNTVLVSLFWQEQLFPFLQWRYSLNMKDRKIIVGGNYPTSSPNVFKYFDCDVFMGDGELFKYEDDTYLASLDGTKEKAVAKELNPFAYIETQKAPRALCEISRGCKNKCLFCQYSWLKPYRNCDVDKVYNVLVDIKEKNLKIVRCFAADRLQHPNIKDIELKVKELELADISCDVTLKNILKHPEGVKNWNSIQIGLEGMSERLRKMVNKPISNDEVIECCKVLVSNKKKIIQFYMIYGLPTECDKDVDEFELLIAKLDESLPEKFTVVLHWNAFQPNAQTPFQWAAPAYSPRKRLKEFWNKQINKNIMLVSRPRETSAWTMIKRVIGIRLDESTTNLAYTIAIRGDTRASYGKAIESNFYKKTGIELMGEWPVDRPLPWDRFCVYDKELMLKMYQKAITK
jgi:radical SAM superfamily enzyme YgiQ (UPF0313 family)